jgi:hypothetical protein
MGRAATGYNPTDRGNAGTERHLLTGRGIPRAFSPTGANIH